MDSYSAPLIAPNAYMLNVPDPTAAVQKNLEIVNSIANSQRQQQMAQQEMQLRAAQTQEANQKIAGTALMQQQDADFGQQLQVLRQKPGGPTTDDIIALGATPSGMRHGEQVQQMFGRADEKEKSGLLDLGTRAYSAMDKGKFDVAQQLLQNGSDAYKNSGQAQYAQMLGNYAKGISDDPALAKTGLGMFLDKLNPKFVETFGAQKGQPNKLLTEAAQMKSAQIDANTEQSKRDSEINKSNSEAASSAASALKSNQELIDLDRTADDRASQADSAAKTAAIGVDQAKQNLNAPTKEIGNQITDLTQKSVSSLQKAGQIRNLATMLKAAGGPTGTISDINEFWKKTVGGQDKLSALLKQFTTFSNENTVRELPLGGRPNETIFGAMREGNFPASASLQDKVDALSRAADMQEADAKISRFSRDWIANNGRQGFKNAQNDFVAGGTKVNKGDNPSDVMIKQVLPTLSRSAGGTAPIPGSDAEIIQRLGISPSVLPDLRKAAKSGDPKAIGLINGTHVLRSPANGG